MKAFGILFAPIMTAMIGMHVWARAESLPKTIEHVTPAFVVTGSMLENWRVSKYEMTITAKKPIWVLVADYRDKDKVIRLNPKQSVKLSNEPKEGTIGINQLDCTVRILVDDEKFEYKAC